MHERKRNLLSAAAAVVCLMSSSGAWSQATDVDCAKCVDTKDLAYQSVTNGKLKAASVTTSKIANQAVTGAKIRNGAVTDAKLADGLRNKVNAVADVVDRVEVLEGQLAALTDGQTDNYSIGRHAYTVGHGSLNVLASLIADLGYSCAEANYGRFYACTEIVSGDNTIWPIGSHLYDYSLALVAIEDVQFQSGVPSAYVLMAQVQGGVGMVVGGSANLRRWTFQNPDDVSRLVDDCDQPTVAMSPPSITVTSTRWRVNNGGYYYTPLTDDGQVYLGDFDVTGQPVGIVRNINPHSVFEPDDVTWCEMSTEVTGIYRMYDLEAYPFNLEEARFSNPLIPQ